MLSPRPPIKVSIPDDPAASSIDTSEKLVAILTAIKKYGSCDNDGPRDAFEVGLFIHQGEDGIRNALSKAASFSKISSKIPDQKKWSAADVRRIAKELRDKYRLNEGVEGNATALFDFNFLEALNELFQSRQSSKQESSFVASVQKALCIRFTNGAVGDLTREAIENYLRGMQKPVPKTIDPDSAALKPMLQAAIDDVGDCTKSGFADAYEVGWLGVPASQSTNRIRNLQETINQFLKMKNSPVSVVATGKLDQQTRKAIDEFQELTGSSGEGSERMRELVLALP